MGSKEYSNVLEEIFEEAIAVEASEVFIFNGEVAYLLADGEIIRINTTEERSQFLAKNYKEIILSVIPEGTVSREKFNTEGEAEVLTYFGGERFSIKVGQRGDGWLVFSARRISKEENLPESPH